jgi:hypothetical protein
MRTYKNQLPPESSQDPESDQESKILWLLPPGRFDHRILDPVCVAHSLNSVELHKTPRVGVKQRGNCQRMYLGARPIRSGHTP